MKPQSGSTLVETLLIGLLLFVPLLWLMAVLSDVHRAGLALSAAAREAGEEFSRAGDLGTALASSDRAIAQALTDHGLTPGRARVDVEAPDGLERGARIEIEISFPVSVARAPFLGEVASGPTVWVSSSSRATVDRFATRP